MKKILYIINIDWFFISHFLPVALEAKSRGYEVHISCAITDRHDFLENLGFIIHPLNISRKGINLSKELNSMIHIFQTIMNVNPTIVEFLTIKPILYGGIVSKLLPKRKKIFYITGLGYIFIKKGFIGTIVKSIVKLLYKMAISGRQSIVITENLYDKDLINSLHSIEKNQITMIKGAGVDINKYVYTEENDDETTVTMASRLLKDKGIFEYVEAAKILREKGLKVKFELYGDIDDGNPTTLTLNDIKTIKGNGYVQVNGFCNDITTIFSNANIIVLPSYREGLPKVLIEAAACGRAIVTTDVPGCRDAIIPNITGLLCKVKDAQSLAAQIERLLLNKNLRKTMGKAGRELAEKEFDITKIVKKHFQTYETTI